MKPGEGEGAHRRINQVRGAATGRALKVARQALGPRPCSGRWEGISGWVTRCTGQRQAFWGWHTTDKCTPPSCIHPSLPLGNWQFHGPKPLVMVVVTSETVGHLIKRCLMHLAACSGCYPQSTYRSRALAGVALGEDRRSPSAARHLPGIAVETCLAHDDAADEMTVSASLPPAQRGTDNTSSPSIDIITDITGTLLIHSWDTMVGLVPHHRAHRTDGS